LLPLVEDDGWFFDTELLSLAERAGLRIHEVPVDWIDDPDSRVDIVATARADVAGVVRLARARMAGGPAVAALRDGIGRRPLAVPAPVAPRSLWRQLAVFAAIGVVSTLAYLVLFLMLRGVVSAQEANLLGLLFTAIGNTAANRRLTFGVRGAAGATRAQLHGLLVFVLGLGMTSGALALLHDVAPAAPRLIEVAVLIGATAVSTVVRFVLFRTWVFGPARTWGRVSLAALTRRLATRASA
jgi:putative flippase GtrA